MPWVLSRYNVYVERPFGERSPGLIVFNSLTGALVAMDATRAQVEELPTVGSAASGTTSPERERLFKALRDQRIIIDSGHDELAYLQRARSERVAGTETLRLTVLLTLFCNLACTYCYESLDGPAMDDQTEKRLSSYVERAVGGGLLKVFDVNWFGGEALLEWPRLVRLSDGFRRVADKAGCAYLAGLATNGYLLDSERIRVLPTLGVRSLVVTLDGPPRVHDRRRVRRDGGPTFERILGHIENLATSGLEIGLQVNCDASTIGEMGELFEVLGPVRGAVVLHFRWVFPRPDGWRSCGLGEDASQPGNPPRRELLGLARTAVAAGFRVRNPLVHPRVSFCNTDFHNHWVIHPTGDLYKCNVEFERGEPCGRLTEDGMVEVDPELVARWRVKDPFSYQACRDCVWLPVCMGGCAFALAERGRPQCPFGETADLSEYIKLEYLQRKGGAL